MKQTQLKFKKFPQALSVHGCHQPNINKQTSTVPGSQPVLSYEIWGQEESRSLSTDIPISLREQNTVLCGRDRVYTDILSITGGVEKKIGQVCM